MAKRITDKKRPNGEWNQQSAMEELRKKCYTEVLRYFHNYSPENKLRIALCIFGKDFTPRPEQSPQQQAKGLTIQLVNFDRRENTDSRIEVRQFDTLASV